MRVLVDTTVWSLALRRRAGVLNEEQALLRQELTDLIADDRVAIVGPVRQEVLSGVRDPATFDRLRLRLRAFEDEPLDTDDFETAARMHNRCRQAGISGSVVDLLLCAVAQRRELSIFTTDADFTRYGTVLPIALHHPAGSRTPPEAAPRSTPR